MGFHKLLVVLATAALSFGQTPTPPAPEIELPEPAGIYAIIETSLGRMVALLYDDLAPVAVKNFIDLAEGNKITKDRKGKDVRQRYYDGLFFHRVIKGFMIQGGCPNSKVGARGAPGTGGPGYMVKAEFNNRAHVKGVLSMARSSDPDSAGSQFFVCHGDASFLNNKYTAFGKLVAGEEVLNKIAAIRCVGMEGSTPTERVEIISVELVEAK